MKIRIAQKSALSRPTAAMAIQEADGDHQAGDGLHPEVLLDAVADAQEGGDRLLPLLAGREQADHLALPAAPRGEDEAEVDQHEGGGGGEALQAPGHLARGSCAGLSWLDQLGAAIGGASTPTRPATRAIRPFSFGV